MTVIGLVLGLFVLNAQLISMADNTTERLQLLLTASDWRNTVDASGVHAPSIHAPTNTINPTLNRSSVLWCFKHNNAIEKCDWMFYFLLGTVIHRMLPIILFVKLFQFYRYMTKVNCFAISSFLATVKSLSDIWNIVSPYFFDAFGLFVSPQ